MILCYLISSCLRKIKCMFRFPHILSLMGRTLTMSRIPGHHAYSAVMTEASSEGTPAQAFWVFSLHTCWCIVFGPMWSRVTQKMSTVVYWLRYARLREQHRLRMAGVLRDISCAIYSRKKSWLRMETACSEDSLRYLEEREVWEFWSGNPRDRVMSGENCRRCGNYRHRPWKPAVLTHIVCKCDHVNHDAAAKRTHPSSHSYQDLDTYQIQMNKDEFWVQGDHYHFCFV